MKQRGRETLNEDRAGLQDGAAPFLGTQETETSKYHTLYNFYTVLFKRKKMILYLFSLTFFLIFLSTLLIEPRYKAVCKVLVRHNRKQEITLYRDMEAFSLGMNIRVNPMANFVELATSRDLAAQIVRKYHLDERLRERDLNPRAFRDVYRKYYDAVTGSPIEAILWILEKLHLVRREEQVVDYFQKAIDEFLNHIQLVLVVSETEVISNEIWGDSIQESAQMANDVARLMIEQIRNVDIQEAQTALAFATEQHERILQDLLGAEQRLLQFQTQNEIVDKEDENKILSKKLELLETQRTMELTRKVELESRVQTLQQELARDFILPQTYQRFTNELMDTQKELAVLSDKLLFLGQSLAGTRKQSTLLGEKVIQLNSFQREVDTKQNQVKLLREAIEKLEVQRVNRLSEHDFVVIEEAKPWEYVDPTWPDYMLNILLGLLAGFAVGLLVPFFVEFWRETFTGTSDVEKRLGLPVLAVLPEFPRRKVLPDVRPSLPKES